MRLNKLIMSAIILCLMLDIALGQSPRDLSTKLRYNFIKGQKVNVKWEETSNDVEEDVLASSRVASGDTKENSFFLEVVDVSPGGEAMIAMKFDSARFTKLMGNGLSFTLDTQRDIYQTNPGLAQLGEQAKPILAKLESFRQVIASTFMGAPFQLSVNSQGKVTRMTGYDAVMDKYREEAAKLITDKSKRAELDALIEGLFGEGAVNKLFSFSLFIPYPAEPVRQGQGWSERFEFEIGPIRLPVRLNFKLASEPVPAQALRISATMEFETPTKTAEVEFAMPKNIVHDDITVDAKTGLPMKRQYAGRLEMEAYTTPSAGRRLLMRFSSDLKGSMTISSIK
jgi:hypothetical protein